MRYKLETIGLGKRYGESVALAPPICRCAPGNS